MQPKERVFLGWDGPCLPRAARWLVERYGTDLGAVTVVTSGGRAGRRLLELLVEVVEPRALTPPRILTPGSLPEQLYGIDPHPGAKAEGRVEGLRALLIRAYALRHAEAARLEQVVPNPPRPDDLMGWLALARELEVLQAQLAAEGLRMGDVPDRCRQRTDFPEEERWLALAELQAAYERTLADLGLRDIHTARFDAVEQRCCTTACDIVLVGVAEIGKLVRAMLEQVADRVSVLVHAPAEEADHFDAFGTVNVEHWSQRKLNLDESQLLVVDRPRDQAAAVAAAIRAYQAQAEKRGAALLSADQITVGLGDAALGPMVQRVLELAGVPARLAEGRPLSQSPPALLLDALARFLESRRLDDFAALARHADIERYVPHAGSPGRKAPLNLSLMDGYAGEHLQEQLRERWLGDDGPVHDMLGNLYHAVTALAPDDVGAGFSEAGPATPSQCPTRKLPRWSAAIGEVLRKAYGHRELQRHDVDDARLIRAIEALGKALRELAALPADEPTVADVTFPQAIHLALEQLETNPSTDDSGEPAVELLGWLELHLDDAPLLIVTGFNEGMIPQSLTSDAFLPDSVRKALGLTDNQRRYARDLMMLTTILHGGKHVRLIAGRRGHDDNPLMPSRLALACDDRKLAPWITTFYSAEPDVKPPTLLLEPAEHSRFLIPLPELPQPWPQSFASMRVTAFRAYIQCPYRFYLEHVLKLQPQEDGQVELDGMGMGNLIHAVLYDFGTSDRGQSGDPRSIAEFLNSRLDRRVEQQFGRHPRMAIRIQHEMMRRRLEAWATWQAKRRAQGWTIMPDLLEQLVESQLDVDGKPFTIRGKVDRVDRHKEHGWQILDYKTGDKAQSPEATHRMGPKDAKQWVDLQLPLYHAFADKLGLDGTVNLGYVNLPKKLEEVGLVPATWSAQEIESAMERARGIIRDIRRSVFWPPAPPPTYDDGFEAICMDACLLREQVIRSLTTQRPAEAPTP